jgi:hypothetical protein
MAISPKRDTGSDKDPLTATMPRPWVLVLLQVLVLSPMYMIGWLSQDPAFGEVGLWGFTRYWIFDSYDLAFLPAALMACVLVDVHGSRRVMRAGLLVYAAGLALAGAASLLDGIGGGFLLLAGQAIAGLGAGVLQVVVVTALMARAAGGLTSRSGASATVAAVAVVILVGSGADLAVIAATAAAGWPTVPWVLAAAAVALLMIGLPAEGERRRAEGSLEIGVVSIVAVGLAATLVSAVETSQSGRPGPALALAVVALPLGIFIAAKTRPPWVKVIARPATLLGFAGAAAIGLVLAAAGVVVLWQMSGNGGLESPAPTVEGLVWVLVGAAAAAAVARRHQRAMLLVWPVLLVVAAGLVVPGWAGVGPVVCVLIGAGATGVLAAVFTLSAERVLGPAGTPGDPADEVRNPVPRPAPLAGWIVLGWASGQAAESFLYRPIIDLTSILETAPALLCLSGALVAQVTLLALRPRPSTAR